MFYRWVQICKKCTEISDNGEFFRVNEWNFHTSTFRSLINAVKHAPDGNQFDTDFSQENGFQWDLYIKNYMLGIRKFILKDDLSTLPVAKTKVYRQVYMYTQWAIRMLFFCTVLEKIYKKLIFTRLYHKNIFIYIAFSNFAAPHSTILF